MERGLGTPRGGESRVGLSPQRGEACSRRRPACSIRENAIFGTGVGILGTGRWGPLWEGGMAQGGRRNSYLTSIDAYRKPRVSMSLLTRDHVGLGHPKGRLDPAQLAPQQLVGISARRTRFDVTYVLTLSALAFRSSVSISETWPYRTQSINWVAIDFERRRGLLEAIFLPRGFAVSKTLLQKHEAAPKSTSHRRRLPTISI